MTGRILIKRHIELTEVTDFCKNYSYAIPKNCWGSEDDMKQGLYMVKWTNTNAACNTEKSHQWQVTLQNNRVITKYILPKIK